MTLEKNSHDSGFIHHEWSNKESTTTPATGSDDVKFTLDKNLHDSGFIQHQWSNNKSGSESPNPNVSHMYRNLIGMPPNQFEVDNESHLSASKPPNDKNMYRSLWIPSNDFQVDASETNLSKTTSSVASTAFFKKNERPHNTGFIHHELSNTRLLNGTIIQNPNVGKEFRSFRGMTSNHSEVDTGETKSVTTTAENQYQFSTSKKASNGKQEKFDHRHWNTIKPRQHTNVEEPDTVSGNPQEDITSAPEVKVGNSTQVYIGDEFERAALKIHNDFRKRHQAPPLILDKAVK